MKTFRKTLAVILLAAAVVFAAGCTKPEDPNNGGNNNGGGNNGGGDTPQGPTVPTGAVGGVFTVNEHGGKVYFSRGNLQWSATNGGATATTHAVADGGTAPGTWRFGEPWDFVGGKVLDYFGGEHIGNVAGSDNSQASSTYTGWLDLFNWGTSGWEGGVEAYYPYSMIGDPSPHTWAWQWYVLGGDEKNGMTGQYAYADWGVYNAISNGGNQPGLWRTLTDEEWEYVIGGREGSRWCPATVNGVKGIILIPDGWDNTAYTLERINAWSSASSNTINQSTWERTCEPAGLVFLPNTAQRSNFSYGGGVYEFGLELKDGYGMYWSSSLLVRDYQGGSVPYGVSFSYGSTGGQPWEPGRCTLLRERGSAIRLVQDVH